MTSLPPRKISTVSRESKEKLTPLQTLLQLGFAEDRAEKALAATGGRCPQLASDWLLAHISDPTLNQDLPREYILYVCPTGPLAARLMKLFYETKDIEWNAAHNYHPHITLTSFFKAPDKYASKISSLLTDLVQQHECPDHLNFEKYISPNFMGLFIQDDQAESLRSLATRLIESLAEIGIKAPPAKTSLHLSLAYQFSDSSFQALSRLVENLDITNVPVNWEIRLYSRDSRFRDTYVHKVMHCHIPRESDELELRPGDLVYIRPEAIETTVDGWVEGISWLTGCSGVLPLNYTRRGANMDGWTIHTVLPIIQFRKETAELISENNKLRVLNDSGVDVPDGIPQDDEPTEATEATSLGRQIYICRHGERVDFTFGAWIPYCFETNGRYVRRDLNMPKEVPLRTIQDFQGDTPLTTFGEVQASLVGDAMKLNNVHFEVAISSPSLRCIQTARHILKGLGLNIPLKIEPGLLEWLAWYPAGIPTWMTSEELVKAGFNVDLDYVPFIKKTDLPPRENSAQYYDRSYSLIRHVMDTYKGNVLLVGHAATLSSCTRQLLGGTAPSASELAQLVQKIPYLACLVAKEEPDGWQLMSAPFPPITHTSNNRFDWKVLL